MTGWHGLSRRELLKRTAVLGAAATVPLRVALVARQAAPLEGFVTLTASEADTLEAIVARLIPTDEDGPGATEARAASYIDRALGGALASSRETYAEGLAATDAYARASKGAPFATLAPADQDRILGEMEEGVATGFEPSSRSFFNLVRSHTIQGTFCDPYYGGNADFVGWVPRPAAGRDRRRPADGRAAGPSSVRVWVRAVHHAHRACCWRAFGGRRWPLS